MFITLHTNTNSFAYTRVHICMYLYTYSHKYTISVSVCAQVRACVQIFMSCAFRLHLSFHHVYASFQGIEAILDGK